MLTTSESLSQIALACGLADQAHLSRRFRQVTGTTPGAWRRCHDKAPAGPMATVDQAAAGSHQRPYPGAVAIIRRKVPGRHLTSTEVACLSA
jgi:AraC-like DNA-binding protein